MGQRLDRPTSSASSATLTSSTSGVTQSNGQQQTAVSNSLSTTFSSSSSSSNSSSNSTNPNNLNSISSTRHSNIRQINHRRNLRTRGSVPETIPDTGTASSSTPTSLANADLANMSPRTRFRTEMARRGYTTSSSDLFFRLFQFPTLGSSNRNTNDSNASAASTTTSPTSAASSTSTSTPAIPATSSSFGGSGNALSAFRFFNLGGNSSSNNNNAGSAAPDLDSDLSSDDDEPHWNNNLSSLAHSLPFFFGMRDFKCFVCNKLIPADDVEAHIMMCLTKPRLTYNDDILTEEKGECIICFELLEKGQTIARLPCLCIYHKHCIDNWLNRSQSCPGHPPD